MPATILAISLAGGAGAPAATLPDLFQKAKLRVAAGDFQGGLAALDELEAEAARPENAPARAALRPAAAFYRGVCLSSIGRVDEARAEFSIFIAANPEKGIDRNVYPRRVVAVFDDARKGMRGGGSGAESISSLAFAYRQMPPPRGDGAAPGPEWATGPARHLLTPQEARSFAKIPDDRERAEFVSQFWRGSDPLTAGTREEFRREFERRAAFADEHFGEDNVRGSLTDRGMVFILMGPPSAVIRRPIAAADDTPSMLSMSGTANPAPRGPIGLSPSDQPANWREVWRFNRDLLPAEFPYQLVDFAFQTRIDYGKNVLQREPAVLRALDEARGRWRTPAP
ncbi:MAG: GWxTD domain-containing protein [Acidobacteriota bacterium]|nr:GWxTD domain-containing protein [Acidobacteriota bacterium]